MQQPGLLSLNQKRLLNAACFLSLAISSVIALVTGLSVVALAPSAVVNGLRGLFEFVEYLHCYEPDLIRLFAFLADLVFGARLPYARLLVHRSAFS